LRPIPTFGNSSGRWPDFLVAGKSSGEPAVEIAAAHEKLPHAEDVVAAEVNDAGRTVLAALGLCGAVLAADRGLDLRSRCLLWPTAPLKWELLDRPGNRSEPFELDADTAIKLLADAVAEAKAVGLPWMERPLKLKPAKKLVELVRKSQELAIVSGGEGGES
jgi:CRISPR-associated protein Csb1